jgi:hypothetical protein
MVRIFTVLGMSALILSVLTTVVNPGNCLQLLIYIVFVHRCIPGVSCQMLQDFIQTMNAIMTFGDSLPSYHTNHIAGL